ncbi:MAG: Trk system potassium transporter TrkA [Gammaproteobacteria bacterium]|nr:Trk system potassium transporter TrkA [Gammaproteobacteria bacterium]
MKVIILGANHFGVSLALNLIEEDNDVTLIDENPARLHDIQHRFDLRTLVGRGSHPDVLQRADADDADVLIALAEEDEVNIIACRIAHTIYNIPTKIAMVRTRAYLDERERLFGRDAIPIDVLVSPEQVVSRNISLLINHPGALQIAEFGGGRLQLVCAVAREGGRLPGRRMDELPQILPGLPIRIAAFYRGDRAVFPDGDTRLQAGDEVFFIAPSGQMDEVTAALGWKEKLYRRIIIAGGGHIGSHLAELLQDDHHVKLIEADEQRARLLAERLDRVVVLHNNATSEAVLLEENIAHTDMFCALTSDDEDNILSAMLAKQLGARKVLALINRPSYVEMIRGSRVGIDIPLFAQQASLGQLLRHLRKGDTVAVHSLRRGQAEALEIVAHGDARTSHVVGRSVGRLRLPPGAVIGAIVRGEEVVMASRELVIESNDHVVIFADRKKRIPDIEKLFQVSATFL